MSDGKRKPKRIRDDPDEYLGGDISSDISFVGNENGDDKRPATKAERNAMRRKANKEWKVSDRLVDSGKDPNPRHTIYYKQQLPCLQSEWNEFQESLCSPLPVTFRFGGGCPGIIASSIKKRVAEEFRTMRGRYVELNGVVLTDNIVKPVSWCQSWQIAADSGTLARSEALSPLYDLLCREVSLGNIVRQELASMIPVLLLDVHHNHTVLDVCAAPGSKTEQILAAMQHHGENAGLGTVCSGMVVANDADPKRILTLKKRYARCGRPNLLINCSRAEDLYRSIKGKFKFDRIVADVPCSGDGTFRKFSHLWRLFRPRVSLELHLIQLQIAKASALMLRAGGRMIYSTCSINPLEDEAVVAALLLYSNGKLTLVDVEKEGLLPGLKKRPGISTWTCDSEIFTVGEADEAAKEASKSRLTPLVPSMYPPCPEVAAQLHLNRCVRILPHDQDTGGFFVAVLEMASVGDVVVPYTLPPLISCDIPESGTDAIRGNDSAAKKISTGISEARTLQTFKSLGFNAKSRQKEKMKMTKKATVANSTGDVDAKLDSTRCTLYESLGLSYSTAKGMLHFSEGELCDGLVDSGGEVGLQPASSSTAVSSTCCLVIATSVTLPEVVEKKGGASGDVALSKEEEEILKLRKLQQKSRDSNGIFGSRSTGWVKVTADEEEEVEKGPYKKVQLVSRCVESALRTWARSDMVIQAGVTVCHHQQSSGSWTLEPDGARSFLPHIERDRVVYLSVSDFSFFLRQGVLEDGEGSVLMFQDGAADDEGAVSVGVEFESLTGDVRVIDETCERGSGEAVLSNSARQLLWDECERMLDYLSDNTASGQSAISLIIGIADLSSSPVSSGDETRASPNMPNQPKRRLSKAEKKIKKAVAKNGPDTSGLENMGESTQKSEGLEKGIVLVLSASYNIKDGAYEGIRLKVSTAEDSCSSYLTAVLSLKL